MSRSAWDLLARWAERIEEHLIARHGEPQDNCVLRNSRKPARQARACRLQTHEVTDCASMTVDRPSRAARSPSSFTPSSNEEAIDLCDNGVRVIKPGEMPRVGNPHEVMARLSSRVRMGEGEAPGP